MNTTEGTPAVCGRCGSRQRGVCSVLDEDQLTTLSDVSSDSHLKSGEEVFLEGNQVDDIVVVKHGAVAVYRLMEDGRRSIARFMFDGDILGVALEGDASQTVRALNDTVLCRLPRSRFMSSLEDSSDMSTQMVTMMSSELKIAQEQLLALGRKTAAERLAGFFIWLSFKAAMREGNQFILTLPMSRTDIADYLGLTIETVSRTFAKFRREGLIELKGTQTVHVRDVDSLAEVAGLDDLTACGFWVEAATS